MANGQEEFVDFIIKPDGTVEMELEGFQGQGCAALAKELIDKLGKNKSTTKKAEYFQERAQQPVQRIKG